LGNPQETWPTAAWDPQRPHAEYPVYLEDAVELSPDWVVGFVDGEGCFHVSITRHPEMSVGYQVLPEFVVVQHNRDRHVLFALKKFFGAGVVRSNHGDRDCLRIRNLAALHEVCEFFLHHPMKTKKQVDFLKFRDVILKIQDRRHLKPEGLLEIIDICMAMNTSERPALEEIKRRLLQAG
jgi:hypothetical protein